jgi:hypothetical protein
MTACRGANTLRDEDALAQMKRYIENYEYGEPGRTETLAKWASLKQLAITDRLMIDSITVDVVFNATYEMKGGFYRAAGLRFAHLLGDTQRAIPLGVRTVIGITARFKKIGRGGWQLQPQQ